GQVFRTVAKMALPNKVWGDEPEPTKQERMDQLGDGHPMKKTKEGLQANADGNVNAEPANFPESASGAA
ncbi:MAG: hypothetical protein QOJ32_1899, partial [Frankiaceae bacterium]|nr:hypothetical protein [Frankiaceae bacterium]